MSATPQRAHLGILCLLAAAVTVSVCSDSPTEPQKAARTFSASIDGAAWVADTTVTVTQAEPGQYQIFGRSKSDASFFQVALILAGITKPGTYPLGTYSTVSGGYVHISNGQDGPFISPTTGSAGEVVITTLSSTRIAGTFALTAVGGTGGISIPVTNGVFDLPVGATGVGPVLDSVGGYFRGTVDDETFSAAGATAYLPNERANRMTLFAYNDAFETKSTEIYVNLENITSIGSYPLDLSALRYMSVTQNRYVMRSGGGKLDFPIGAWHSQIAGSTGTVTITTLTASRIAGTLTATLAPTPESPLARSVTLSATFDLGRRSLIRTLPN